MRLLKTYLLNRHVAFFILIFTAFAISSFTVRKKTNIWLIGDSTMAPKKESARPEAGWGEGLEHFVRKKAIIHNHAVNGRSSKSFIDEGRWKNVLDSIQEGDFLVIQFGHNDEKRDETRHTDPFTTYQSNIKMFIEEANAKGVHPIVCSSIIRRHFDEAGQLIDTHGDYITAANAIAKDTNTPYVNMEKLTRQLIMTMGPEKSKALFNFCKPGDCENYKNGIEDQTHLNQHGAEVVARLFVNEVNKQKLKISKLFK